MLFDKLQDDLKQAQLAKDEVKVATLRLLLSEIHNSEIQKGGLPAGGLADSDVISVIQREVKKRKEGAEGFRSGGREDKAQKEEVEAKILESYLPSQIEDRELTEIVNQAITEVGASGISDMGKVMGLVMGKVGGRADGGRVSELVKARLSS